MQLKEIMTPGVEVVTPEATIQEAAEKMRHLDIGPLPVCDGDRLVGLLTDRDITGVSIPLSSGELRGKVTGAGTQKYSLALIPVDTVAGALNQALQAALNPGAGPAVERFGSTFRAGDKVMQTENDYDKEVWNGDLGFVESIDPDAQELAIAFDGRVVTYDFGELDQVALAYATTIHKSQGSEYPAVILTLSTQHYPMLQRNLLYTGITRGQRLVVLLGERRAL